MTKTQRQDSDAHDYRYERKFLVSGLQTHQLASIVRLHPLVFSSAYPDRSVNNIYFDTEDFQYYRDNVEGVSNRRKIRIRWYGSLRDTCISPVLEYKIKRGPVGYKVSYPLAHASTSSRTLKVSEVLEQMLTCDLPPLVRQDLLSHRPVILNSYRRQYFLSRDRRFRITIDDDLTYYKVNSDTCNLDQKDTDYKNTVIELKYSQDDDNDAKSISNTFPFRMTKNSKYVSGVNRTYGGDSHL